MVIREIKSSFSIMSVEEQESLLLELGRIHNKLHVSELTRRSCFDNKYGSCPHCSSSKYRKHGIDKGSQRYKCNGCGRTFTEYSGTWMSGLHKKKLVGPYLKLMEQELSLDKIKLKLGINKKTAFDWRHKILSSLESDDKSDFEGITESDETLFRFSQKGSSQLGRKAHKRGGTAGKGIGQDQVSVMVTRDRTNKTDFSLVGRGRINKKDIETVIGKRVTDKTILCSDGDRCYKGFAIDRGLEHYALHANRQQRVIKGVYHIQHVNAIHSRLKKWLIGHFVGVSTKYLQKYLNWFQAKEALKFSANFSKEFAAKTIQNLEAIDVFKNIQPQFEKLCSEQR